ncbi:MAG: hypothetical protein IT379_39275 [Deltaproteobacteria bacterium]|nr:hypothetical protein [Deltaproteobacteria bacterium]
MRRGGCGRGGGWSFALAFALVLSVDSACTSDEPHSDRCVPGASASCACVGGRVGAQVCGDDSRFGPCVCDPLGDAAGGTDAALDASAADGAGEDARIELDGSEIDAAAPTEAGPPDAGVLDAAGDDAATNDGGAVADDAGCASDRIACDGLCIDPSVDPRNCGVCGNVCPAVAVCTAGACDCPGDEAVCSGACVDLTADAENCGACGTTCRPDLPCRSSECRDLRGIGAGIYHVCAVRLDGEVLCWGANDRGQIGDGTVSPTVPQPLPTLVVGITDAVQVGPGYRHTCAVRAGGTISCWGDNEFGQLGDGSRTSSPTPVLVMGITDAVQVTSGTAHSCARLASGAVRCWGRSDHGQLGDGTTVEALTPVPVATITDATFIATWYEHTCAVSTSRGILCWGRNAEGQLGDGTLMERHEPVAVVGFGETAVHLATGERHTCAVGASGTARCWGDNGGGILGDGTDMDSPTPVVVMGIEAAQVALGNGHTCAITATGTTYCWAALARWDGTMRSRLPVLQDEVTEAVALASGVDFACVIRRSAEVRCWGNNYEGEAGNGTVSAHSPPSEVVVGLP